MPSTFDQAEERFRWLFLFNAILVAVAALPLLLAYPTVFTRLGIASLENGFFVRLAGGWLFVEAIASYLAWRRPRGNADLVYVIIAMKVVFIVLVILAALAGTLPASAFLFAAVVDLVLSIVFGIYLSRTAGQAP